MARPKADVLAQLRRLEADLAKAERIKDMCAVKDTKAKLAEMNRRLDHIERELRNA